jgi:hypothetical protein
VNRTWYWAPIVFLAAVTASATTFVVPDDEVLIRKSDAIVAGTVMFSYARRDVFGGIETVTAVQVRETLKGALPGGGLIEVLTPGGILDGEAMLVHGSPRFLPREDVLLLLSRNRSRWEVTDLALGAFHVEQWKSLQIVRRSSEIEGWHSDGAPWGGETARDHSRFRNYVRRVVRGEKPTADYLTHISIDSLHQSSDVLRSPQPAIAPYVPSTYTSYLSTSGAGSSTLPPFVGTRWRQSVEPSAPAGTQTMPGGVRYFKTPQSLGGAADGGVGGIQTALANWNNDCASAANLMYAGQTSIVSASDTVNVIEFNDPQGRIAGSFSAGGGTVAITFSTFNNVLSINGEYWWVFKDADIVFQDGVTAGFAAILSTMTHEVGHSIGFRHSNATRTNGNDSNNSCNGSDEECAFGDNVAVMYWRSFGSGIASGALQPWDLHAVQAVYPGGSCGAVSRVRQDFNADGRSDIVLQHNVTGEIAEYLMNGTSILTGAVVGNPGVAYAVRTTGDYNGDGRADLALQHASTNDIAIWLMNGTTLLSGVLVGNPGSGWRAVGSADLNADGTFDLVLQNQNNGDVAAWLMNGGRIAGGAVLGSPGPAYPVVGVADFNGDGRADILMQNGATGDMAQWQLNGLTISRGGVVGGAGPLYVVRGVGDTNGDGRADIILRNTNTGNVAVWLMNGLMVTSGTSLGNPGANYDVAGSADYNGDSRSDILLREGGNGTLAIWLLNGASIAGGAVVATPGRNYVPIVR